MSSFMDCDLYNEVRINDYYTQLVGSYFKNNDTRTEGEAKRRSRIIDTNSFLSKLSKSTETNNIIPSNCRYIEHFDDRKSLVIIEEPPAYRTIKVNASMQFEVQKLKKEGKLEQYGIDPNAYNMTLAPFSFTLAFPYVVFILVSKANKIIHGQAYLRKSRMSGLADYLMKIPLMNISESQSICFGNSIHEAYYSLNKTIEEAIMVFWSATFNTDYTYNYSAYENVPGVGSYIEWQALSKINPMFIYNVEWIDTNKTINDIINTLKIDFNLQKGNSSTFDKIRKIFTIPSDCNQKIIDEETLSYDIASGMPLLLSNYLHVGDSFLWKNKRVYVDSFVSGNISTEIKFIQLMYENGNKFLIKVNHRVIEYLNKLYEETAFLKSAVTKNGVEIKPNDILKINLGSEQYFAKIRNLRKSADGLTEARIGPSYYLVENLDAEIFNVTMDNIQYDGGVALEINCDYVRVSSYDHLNMYYGSLERFCGLDVDAYSSDIVFDFMNVITGKRHPIKPNEYKRKSKDVDFLVKKEDVIQMPEVFRCGRKLFGYSNNAYKYKNTIILCGSDNDIKSYNIEELASKILKNDGTVFQVNGNDHDINFSIGDKVAVSNWDNPMDMLTIKTITGFNVNTYTKSIDFILVDKNNISTIVPFVKGKRYNRDNETTSDIDIYTGRIRHISNTFGELSSGMKIIANQAYIPQFPKKDINIIIGFITDTGIDEPLVLMSNCCTLWYYDIINKFKIIPTTSEKWKTLQHSPIDLSKIKAQAGDIVSFNNASWLLTKNRDSVTGLRIKNLNYELSKEIYTFDSYFKRCKFDSFLNPRISTKDLKETTLIKASSNLHNIIIENEYSSDYFLNDERKVCK